MAEPPKNPRNKGVNDEFSWTVYSACSKQIAHDPELQDAWFADETSVHSAIAADLCFTCPVRQACLKVACQNKEADGVWGGLPATLRMSKGKSHNFLKLVDLPNPYTTEDADSRYHVSNLQSNESGEDNG